MTDAQSHQKDGQEALCNADWPGARVHFEAALAESDEPENHDNLGIALWWLNAIDAAHEHRITAYVGFKHRNAFRRAAYIAAWLAREQVFLNANPSAMRGWFARAERLLSQEGDCPERGWFEVFRASMLATPDELAQVTTNALRIARAFRDAELEAVALAFHGMADVALGKVSQGMAALDEAMACATSGELGNYMAISEIFCTTLSACELAGDLVRTEHWCRAASEFAQRHNCSFLSAYCRTTYGSLQTATGRWQDAETTLTDAIRAFETGHRALRVHAVFKLADLRVCQGRLEEAEILLTGYEDHNAALIPMARLHMVRGEMLAARTLLTQALAAAQPPTLHHIPTLQLFAEASLNLGDLESARWAVEQMAQLAQQTGSDLLLAQADLTSGRLKQVSGEPDAVASFQAALARLQAYEQSLLAGRIRLEMAYSLAESDKAGAITWARAALATFERAGATHDADEAAKVLRELGAGRSAMRTHEALTQRESEVLALVAHGLTNRQIGERLFLSAKTVEHHVGQVLSKLGVRSRAEAAAFAANQSASQQS